MKRILVTILSILYMMSATGATIHIHYCMGKMMSAGLIDHEDHRCGKCGMKKAAQKKGCCKDEHKTFKSSDHQLAKAALDLSFKQIQLAPTPPLWAIRTIPPLAVTVAGNAKVNAPPSFWRTCPIYIQVCNFRI